MKSTRVRSIVVNILAAAFVVGLGFFVYLLLTSGETWASSPINQHLASGQLKSAGSVFDRNGVTLAKSEDGKRVYNDNLSIRRATLHTVGDDSRFISTAVQSAFRSNLVGYNFVTGISLSQFSGRGDDITLTLDSDVCLAAYNALGDRKGAAVVYNYVTGEILGMVSTPTYDPANRPKDIDKDKTGKYDGVYLNRVLSSSYAPGSTFKIITCAAAIENIPDIDTRKFTCKGSIEVDGEKITCLSHHGTIGFEDGMAKSCNIVFAELAMELGKDVMTKTAESMGFNKSLVIEGIPTAKCSYDVSKANKRNLGWSGIGQYTDLVNPMYMAVLCGAIANDGTPVIPYFVDRITSPLGVPTHVGYAGFGERMLKKETAKRLKEIMRYTVKSNYGDKMFPGLTVCAKTGTAEVDEGKQPHGWMVGFSTDEDCPLAFAVIVENSGYGISQAGPVATAMMTAAAKTVRGS